MKTKVKLLYSEIPANVDNIKDIEVGDIGYIDGYVSESSYYNSYTKAIVVFGNRVVSVPLDYLEVVV